MQKKSILAAAFLSSGAALLVYIFSGISLFATFFIILLFAVLMSAIVWRRATSTERVSYKKTIRAGLIAGIWATIAYDISRYILVTVTSMSVWPFEAFIVFGQAFIGVEQSGPLVFTIGTIYHVINGIAFAIAYAIAFARKGWWAGLIWAMVLEACMLMIYPGWLNIQQINQFVQMSLFGHAVYGIVLGYVAKKLIVKYERDAYDKVISG